MPVPDQLVPKKRRLFKFGIRSLLLLVTCFAVLFGGFHIGGRLGYVEGEKVRAKELVVPRIYWVGDLVANRSARLDIKSELEKIHDQSWSPLGGHGEIHMFDSEQLLVNQTAEIHDAVAQALAEMRKDLRGAPTVSSKSSGTSTP